MGAPPSLSLRTEQMQLRIGTLMNGVKRSPAARHDFLNPEWNTLDSHVGKETTDIAKHFAATPGVLPGVLDT